MGNCHKKTTHTIIATTYTVCDVYDGDTIHCLATDIYTDGANVQRPEKLTVRIAGIDAPEVRAMPHESKADAAKHKLAGKIVRDYLHKRLVNKQVRLHTMTNARDKYGRMLCNVVLDGDTVNVTSDLLAKGYAKPYHGKTKQMWTDAELDRIIASSQ